MALNNRIRWPSQTEEDLVNYPFGKAKNVTTDTATDGTPFEKDYINDQWGFFQKLLHEADITPNDTPDTVVTSQYFEAAKTVFGNASGSGTVELSSYVEDTDTRLTQAWDRMLLDIQDPAKENFGNRHIIIDKNPLKEDGRWLHDTPAKLLSGMTVDFTGKNGLIEWVNTDTSKVYRRQRGMFEAIGDPSSTKVTSVTQNISEDDTSITVADSSLFSVGDFLDISIQQDGLQTTSYNPELYWVSEIINIDGNSIELDVKIPWPVNITEATQAGTLVQNKVRKIENIPRDITVNNPYIIDTAPFNDVGGNLGINQPDYVIGPFYFQWCHNVEVNGVKAYYTKCPVVQVREFNSFRINNLSLVNPVALSNGEGYGATMSRGLFGHAKNIYAINERHVMDFTSVWYFSCENAFSPKTRGTATNYIHGRFEAYGEWINCRGKSFSMGGGYNFGFWSKGQVWRNCHYETLGGERTLDLYMEDSSIGVFDVRFYVDRFVAKNCDVGVLNLNAENRLPSNGLSSVDNRGVFITDGSTIRGGELDSYPFVSISDSFARYGGSIQRRLVMDNCHIFKCANTFSENVEFQHSGETVSVGYVNWSQNMNYDGYSSAGEAGIIVKSLELPSDHERVDLKFKSMSFVMDGSTIAKPISVTRGDTAGALSFTFNLTGYTSQNCLTSVRVREDATFKCVSGNILGNTFNTGDIAGLRIEDENELPYVTVPSRIMIGPNNYLNGSINRDNIGSSGGYSTDKIVTLNFNSSTVPANGEVRSLIPFNGDPLASADDVFICSVKGLANGLSQSVYFDQQTDNKWKIKLVNSTSSTVTLTSTTAIVTKFN